jgi:hypothetical protein
MFFLKVLLVFGAGELHWVRQLWISEAAKNHRGFFQEIFAV